MRFLQLRFLQLSFIGLVIFFPQVNIYERGCCTIVLFTITSSADNRYTGSQANKKLNNNNCIIIPFNTYNPTSTLRYCRQKKLNNYHFTNKKTDSDNIIMHQILTANGTVACGSDSGVTLYFFQKNDNSISTLKQGERGSGFQCLSISCGRL